MGKSKRFRGWAIGGGDAAAICGVSPWKTPLQCWAEKCGLIEKQQDNIYTERGRMMEPHLLRVYESVTKRAIVPPTTKFHNHAEFDWAVAPVDAYFVAEPPRKPERGVVDAKLVSHWKRHEWGDPIGNTELEMRERTDGGPSPTATAVPLHINVQTQFYLWITGLRVASYAVGITNHKTFQPPVELREGGHALLSIEEFLWTDVPYNAAFMEHLLPRLIEFVGYVERRERPPWEPVFRDREHVAEILGAETPGKQINLGPEHHEMVVRIHTAMNMMDRAQEMKKKAEAELMIAMDDAAIGILPNKRKVHFKTKGAHDVPPRDGYRVEAKRLIRVPTRIPKGRGE